MDCGDFHHVRRLTWSPQRPQRPKANVSCHETACNTTSSHTRQHWANCSGIIGTEAGDARHFDFWLFGGQMSCKYPHWLKTNSLHFAWHVAKKLHVSPVSWAHFQHTNLMCYNCQNVTNMLQTLHKPFFLLYRWYTQWVCLLVAALLAVKSLV